MHFAEMDPMADHLVIASVRVAPRHLPDLVLLAQFIHQSPEEEFPTRSLTQGLSTAAAVAMGALREGHSEAPRV